MNQRPLIIVKVGTGVLTQDDGNLNLEAINALSHHIAHLRQDGYATILVSSGAVGAGVPILELKSYPADISMRQAAAAVGQSHLLQRYQEALTPHGLSVAQILLSSYDLQEETHRERAKNVLTRLLDHDHILPIVNENDVVSLRELTKTDNDMLAATLSGIMKAQTLVLLTSVDGLLDHDQQVIPTVENVLEASAQFAQDSSGKFSIGGMKSKLEAVKIASDQGTQVIIGNGAHPERLRGYLDQSAIGTYFSSVN